MKDSRRITGSISMKVQGLILRKQAYSNILKILPPKMKKKF